MSSPCIAEPNVQRWALAIHGGAGIINATEEEWISGAVDGLHAALDAGEAVLADGGAAIDAVVAAVRVLEDDPHFNAGVGSVLTASGAHELEASVMTSDGRCGGVTLLRRIRNPVLLAQQVMDSTPHVLLSGEPAEALAVSLGHQLVENDAFTTPQRRRQWQRVHDEEAGSMPRGDEIVQSGEKPPLQSGSADTALETAGGAGQGSGRASSSGTSAMMPLGGRHPQTVGAVARDTLGRLAAATSTGGRTNKWDGRIGDTPIIGAGTWADARCALSGTGIGEEFMRRAAAHDVAARVAYKSMPLQDAVAEVVWGDMAPGDGGFVGVDASGDVVMDWNSQGMYHGCCSSAPGSRQVGVYAAQERARGGSTRTGSASGIQN